MNVQVYEVTVGQFIPMLNNLKGVLKKGKDFADAKKIDFTVLLQTRLAPDQFPLSRQIQISSDMTKMVAGKLTNTDVPAFEDNEQTYDQFIQRIDKTIAFLQKIKPEQFQGFEKATYTSKHRPGQKLDGKSYLLQHAIPNVYFHIATAYSILRSCGVEIGKADYLGKVNWVTE